MDEFIEFIARNLVTDPDAVRVERFQRNHLHVYKLYVAPRDMGRVIGRQGRVAASIRAVMQAAPVGQDRRLALDIQEAL
jgi:predicted RNA-binding protein YlqC (UPF0109 family)